MNCREALELMGDHADGDLGVTTRWRLRLHLWICRNCRRFLSSYRATIRIAKSLGRECADGRKNDIPESLIALILKVRRENRSR